MKQMKNFARATAVFCGALLLLQPTTTQADGSFTIEELQTVGTDEDIPARL